jgi:hypothetical protein
MNFIFHNRWDNPSHWQIFFQMVKTTNQKNYGQSTFLMGKPTINDHFQRGWNHQPDHLEKKWNSPWIHCLPWREPPESPAARRNPYGATSLTVKTMLVDDFRNWYNTGVINLGYYNISVYNLYHPIVFYDWYFQVFFSGFTTQQFGGFLPWWSNSNSEIKWWNSNLVLWWQ